MRKTLVAVVVLIVTGSLGIKAQQKPRGARTATLAIAVSDPGGTPIPNVTVTLEGAASRTSRTEGGRIALEELPAGRYTVRFERDGFVTLERELTATAGKPVEVNVTLKPLPAAPPPPAVERSEPATNAKPARFDVPDVIDKEFVGRGAGKTTALACGDQGTATLIQLNEPLAQHAHADADEFVYVVAGEGSASVEGRRERLSAGVLLFVPRGTPHGFAAGNRKPLVILSTQAGEGCEKK